MKPWLLFIVYGIVMIAVKSVWAWPGDFLLLAVIYLGFYEEWRLGFSVSLIFGFLLDVCSISPMGTGIFSYAIIFGLIRFFRNKILFKTLLSRFCWVAVLTLINVGVSHFVIRLFGQPTYSLRFLFPQLLLSMLINATLGLVWIPFLKWYRNLNLEALMKQKDILLKK